MENSVGSIGAEFTADTSSFTKGVETVKESLEGLKGIAEAFVLEKIFEGIADIALETTKAFDENAMALNRVNAATSGLQTEKFKELAENLSQVSTYSMATSLNAVSMLGKFNLNDQAISQLLPKLQNFASFTGGDLTSAANQFGMAISSGQVSARRLGIDLDATQKMLFKTGDASQRAAILVEALGKYNGMAAKEADTATGAHKVFSNQVEELYASIGSLLDKPVAAFFEDLTAKVHLLTEGFNTLKPELKQSIGSFAVTGSSLAATGVSAAALWKGLGALEGFVGVGSFIRTSFSQIKESADVFGASIEAARSSMLLMGKVDFGGIASTLKGIYTVTKDFATASALAMLPWLAVAVAIAGVTAALITAYGIVHNNIKADTADGIIAGLKEGFTKGIEGISGGIKDKFASLFVGDHLPGEGLNFAGSEGKLDGKGGFEKLGGGSGAQVDTSQVGRYASDRSTGFDVLSDGILDFSKNLVDVQDAWKATMMKTADGVSSRFKDATDASANLAEALAKNADAQLSNPTTALAANTIGPLTANSSTGAQIGSGVVSGVTQQAGAAGQIASAFASGGPIAGAVAAIMAILEPMKSFQTIMKLLNGVITMVSKAVEPIISAVVPLISGVFVMISQIITPIAALIKDIAGPLTAVFTSLGEVFEVIGAVVGTVINILIGVLGPVLKIMEAAWNTTAKIIHWVAEAIVDIYNGIIGIWDDLISAIANAVNAALPGSWGDAAGNSIRAMEAGTISLSSLDTQAANAATAMSGLTTNSENLPEGFKVALANYNAINPGSGSATAGAGLTPAAVSAQAAAILSALGWTPTTPAAGGSTTGSAGANSSQMTTAISSFLKNPFPSIGATTGSTANPALGNPATQGGKQLNIQTVTVQAATPDLIKEIQKNLMNQGFLQSGTRSLAASTRNQYGH